MNIPSAPPNSPVIRPSNAERAPSDLDICMTPRVLPSELIHMTDRINTPSSSTMDLIHSEKNKVFVTYVREKPKKISCVIL